MITRRTRHFCFDWCGQRLISIIEDQRLLAGASIPLTVVCHQPKQHWKDSTNYLLRCEHGKPYYFEMDLTWT